MIAPIVWLAEPHETEAVAGLLFEFRDWSGGKGPPEESFRVSVDRLIRGPDAEFLLASIGRRDPPSGVCQLRYRHSVWTAAEDCLFVERASGFIVREGVRGHGVGRALVESACERARRRGCRRIELDVNEHNLPAIALYEQAGFSARSKRMSGMEGRDLFLGLRLR